MPTTINHAKVGKTTYTIQLFLDNGHDSFVQSLDFAEAPNKGLAVARANRMLTSQWRKHPEDCRVWARITKGTWTQDVYDSDEFGTVRDADWVADEEFYHVRWMNDDTSIGLDEES